LVLGDAVDCLVWLSAEWKDNFCSASLELPLL
jgi:hypothetical protein